MSQIETTDDAFNVIDELSPAEWVDYGFDDHSEYVHIVADRENNEIRCYRSVAEPSEENQRIKTTVEDVHFRYFFEDEQRDINYWYLTYMEAMSFLTYVDLMAKTREGPLRFDWSEADGGPMMDDEATSLEAITLEFTKDNGVERSLQIRSEWQSPKSHKMAKIKGDTY